MMALASSGVIVIRAVLNDSTGVEAEGAVLETETGALEMIADGAALDGTAEGATLSVAATTLELAVADVLVPARGITEGAEPSEPSEDSGGGTSELLVEFEAVASTTPVRDS